MTASRHTTARDACVVFAWLAALTALEVAAVYVVPSRLLLVAFLLATAAAKASLVALYFMHLRWADGFLRFLAAFPFVLGVAFVAALVPDIVLPWR